LAWEFTGDIRLLPHITDRGQHRYIGDKLVVILQPSMAEGLHSEAFNIPILACSMSQSPGFSISRFVSPTVRDGFHLVVPSHTTYMNLIAGDGFCLRLQSSKKHF
jgi:hypothetical protein